MRMLTVSSVYPSSCIKPVPAVRVQGKWLENIGFHVGCKVEIYESDGEITIKLAKSKENSIESAENAKNIIKSTKISENGKKHKNNKQKQQEGFLS